MAKSKFYAVAVGRSVGIFDTWAQCETQVKGFSGAKYQSFKTKTEAESFVRNNNPGSQNSTSTMRNTASVSSSCRNSVPEKFKERETSSAKSKDGNRKRPIASQITDTTTLEPSTTIPPAVKRQRGSNTFDNKNVVSFLLSFDGGSRGNPGMAGCGAEIVVTYYESESSLSSSSAKSPMMKLRSRFRICRYLQGTNTNNQAEYWGLISGLECLRDVILPFLISTSNDIDKSTNATGIVPQNPQQPKHIPFTIQGDSKLVIQQMKGAWKVGEVLSSAHQIAQHRLHQLVDAFQKHCSIALQYNLEHVYRDANKIADECANKAMDSKSSWLEEEDENGILGRSRKLLDIVVKETSETKEAHSTRTRSGRGNRW